MKDIMRLKYFAGGKWLDSEAAEHFKVHDPSTGEIIALAPACTKKEVEFAVASAQEAFFGWAETPVQRRIQVLYRLRSLIIERMDELAHILCRENGKAWDEARGDIQKVIEPIEFACGAPSLMLGEYMLNSSKGVDTMSYREPLGVFAGIAPFNFPGMIPMGWMMPLCIASGNTFVLKAASAAPMTSMRIAELLCDAGLPDGVVNIVTCGRETVDALIEHQDVKGISFVGSTRIGREIYAKAAKSGKRVQALCEAKNHALVLEDAALEQTARAIVNSAFGCAGERCMALPVAVAVEPIADELISLIIKYAKELRIGPAYDPETDLGPVISAERKQSILSWIEKGIAEGAVLVLDGRGAAVEGYENGYFIGPTIFDHVAPEMAIGREEIFGPVLLIKRVSGFEEGLSLMNLSPYANGSVIFTQSGYYGREFARRTHAGMVGVNVGIPVPTAIFPFSGHKSSFFGDLHVLGKDGIKFFTETKCVTSRWIKPGEKSAKVDTWEGTTQRV
ncbi:MAG: CoA-acylating methylmalonate-semialdehyde dehydrogenase [Clostridiales bacterium]|jgi:malonate-semialdehyde dehydrogenase (acetylating)/methylmalonate-semialdehyde dehydrogenase|nr:CoA-acylating methylmalonate-semialdehyde dehydrogenase [Clostridiales bacterium]